MKCLSFVVRLLPLLLLLAILAGCGGRVPTGTIRQSLATDNLDSLRSDLEETQKSYGDFVSSLNLARILQLQGRWQASIAMYNTALATLEEYEGRATISIRSIAASTGTILLSRGSEEYYGTGYERSLLHTFNALNHMMLGDFNSAAVEMRKMEKRQDYWLEESQARVEAMVRERNQTLDSPDDLPMQYSMRDILRDPSIRSRLNSYQDAFSYALSAVVLRIAGDMEGAAVNLRRALLLDDAVTAAFSPPWSGAHTKDKETIAVPPIMQSANIPSAALRGVHGRNSLPADQQELVIIAFSGLAPALGVENMRIFFPLIGYIFVDLPAYKQAVNTAEPIVSAGASAIPLYPLLRTDVLAYRTLWDELRFEIGTAISRALVRAGIAGTTYAVAASHKDSRYYAPLIGVLTTTLLDIFASTMADSVRNWETLPNTGYLAVTTVPRGATITMDGAGRGQSVDLPPDAQGVIIIITELPNNNLKVNHVAY